MKARWLARGIRVFCAATACVVIAAVFYKLGYRDADAYASVPAMARVEGDAVTAFRTQRQQLRQMARAQLNDIIYNQGADSAVIQAAQRQLMALVDREEAEQRLEGILHMRGFEDAVVTLQSDSANIILRGEAPNRQQAAVIFDLILRETGVTSGNVKLIPIK